MIASLLLIAVLVPCAALGQDFDQQAEQQLFDQLNQERARAGLSSLKWDTHLQRAAREHSRLMADAHQLSHDIGSELPLPKRLAAIGLRFNSDGENVAYDSTVEGAHTGFMRSPPHRANILSPKFNAGGIGVVRAGSLLWVTQDFAHATEAYSEQDARNMIIAGFESLRGEARLPSVRVVNSRSLHQLACNMAKQDRLDTTAPLELPNVRSAVAYTESELQRMPTSAQKLARDSTIKSFAVGVCFASSQRYPAGTYWVAMVFY